MTPADPAPEPTAAPTTPPPTTRAPTAPAPNGGAAPAPGEPATIVGEPSAPPANWSDDWRQKMARGDEKNLQHLGRYQSPEAVYDALRNAQQKIDSGVVRARLPDNPTPEQVAEYRKELGVPEAPDKYDLTLPGGLVIGDADKPIVDRFLPYAHAKNWTPAQVKEGLEFVLADREKQLEAQLDRDADVKIDSVAELGKRWGGEYKVNVRVMDTVLDEAPPGVKDAILGARLANGRLFGADADVLDWLVGIARIKYPNPSSIGGSSDTDIRTAQTRINELTKMAGDRNSDYWKRGPVGAGLQAELLRLNEGVQNAQRLRGI